MLVVLGGIVKASLPIIYESGIGTSQYYLIIAGQMGQARWAGMGTARESTA